MVRWLGVILTVGFGLLAGDLPAQESDASAALKKLAPPWYSAETDSARVPEFPDDEPAVSRDRNQIAEGQTMARRAMATPSVNLDWLSPLATWLVLGVLLLLLALLAWWFLPAGGFGERKPAVGDDGPEHALRLEQLPVPVDQAVGDLRVAALRAAGEGDFRKAIVYLFSHSLISLDRRQLLELRRGKTNRQYLGELAENGIPGEGFRGLMLRFERVFFGNHSAAEADFRHCLDACDQLELVRITGGGGAA